MKTKNAAISENQLYPVFLKLDKLHVLVVGGSNVALEKMQSLLHTASAANITLVAPEIKGEIRSLAQEHTNVNLLQKEFELADLNGIDLVLAATNNRTLHEEIKTLAEEKNIKVNVADTPDLCDFYLGSIVNKYSLKIAISTNGKSPTIAKRIKEILAEAIPDEMENVLNNMQQIRSHLNGNFSSKVKKLNEITNVLVEKDNAAGERRWRKIATYSLAAFGLMLIGHFIFSYLPLKQIIADTVAWYKTLYSNFHWMILVGFIAQLIDGALGMGYGVTCTSILLSLGIPLPAISGSIHTAEMFSSGMSGYSHYKFGNVNKKLFKALLIPGVIGAVLGAFLLSRFGDEQARYIRPALAAYTLMLGIRIIYNAYKKNNRRKKIRRVSWLGAAGGFLDSFGGGGWGPLVTSTLIAKGRTPKYVIGSVSISEFFITLASAVTFFTFLGISHWQVIAGLIIGGSIAAPIAAKLAGKLPLKTMFVLVGIMVIVWSLRVLIKAF